MPRKTISAVEARVHFGDLMKRSFKNKERFIVEKSGIPMVVILSASEYDHLIQEREERFKVLDKIRGKMPKVSPSEVEDDIRKATQAIRRADA